MDNPPVSPKPITSTAYRPTKQSKLHRIPWLALASILVVLICIASSISIIVVSNKQTVESWKIQPAVLLAILASVSSVALATAFSVGAVVTWWTSAVEGTSLEQLHYIWDRGQGLSCFSAFAAGGNARKVVLTALVVTVVNIGSNPLLQRSTRQSVDRVVTGETIQLPATKYLPDDWIGTKSGGFPVIRQRVLGIVQAWWRNDTIDFPDTSAYYCDGTCEANVPGAGITHNCISTTQALNLSDASGSVIFAVNTEMFQNSFDSPFLLLTTRHASKVDSTCTATLTLDTCIIKTGVVEYPVIIQGSSITLNTNNLNNLAVLANHTYSGDLSTTTGPFGPLQYLNTHFSPRYLQALATVLDSSTYQVTYGTMADLFLQSNHSIYNDRSRKTCGWTWTSPTNYVLNSMQNFMFRAALRAAGGTDVQTIAVQRTKFTLVFHSVYGYLIAASVITLLGLFLIIRMLPGWWVLGRTLSPLETAKTFSAPVLEHTGSGMPADEIVQDIGWPLEAMTVVSQASHHEVARLK